MPWGRQGVGAEGCSAGRQAFPATNAAEIANLQHLVEHLVGEEESNLGFGLPSITALEWHFCQVKWWPSTILHQSPLQVSGSGDGLAYLAAPNIAVASILEQ